MPPPIWVVAIRRLMAAKNWSQRELSDASGVRPNTLSDILNKRSPTSPRVDTMEQVAKALDVPLWALFCDEHEYALFESARRNPDSADTKAARELQVRAVVRSELAAIAELIHTRLSGHRSGNDPDASGD